MKPLRLLSLFVLFGVFSCSGEVEGDEADECRDGADNDQDGDFDCDDPGCQGSPDCDGTNPDTDDPNDTGGTGDTSEPGPSDAVQAIGSVSVSVELDFDFVDDDLCGSIGICDCLNTYAGSGDQVDVVGTRLTTLGTWDLVSTTCPEAFAEAIWEAEGDPAHLSFAFNDSADALDVFVAHRDEADVEPFPVADAKSEGQFWIDELASPVIDGAVNFEATDNQTIEGFIELNLTTRFAVTLTTD